MNEYTFLSIVIIQKYLYLAHFNYVAYIPKYTVHDYPKEV